MKSEYPITQVLLLFSFFISYTLYDSFVINIRITDGHGHSNETHREFLLNKSMVMLYLPFISHYMAFNQLYIDSELQFFFRSGHAMQVVKLMKEDWPILIQYVLSLKYWSIKRKN